MTTRVKALTVALDRDIREDDVAPLVAAIERLRGVVGVSAVPVDPSDYIANVRARHHYRARILAALERPS
jgi:hypothetical protein